MRSKCVFLFFLLAALLVAGVDRTNFKSCEQSSFCRRCRGMEKGKSTFELVSDRTQITQSSVQAEVVDTKYNVKYSLSVTAVDGGIFRVKMDELNPKSPRFQVPYVLVSEPSLQSISVEKQTAEELIVVAGSNKAVIHSRPLRLEFYSGSDLVAIANGNGLLKFEHLRDKPQPKSGESESESAQEEVSAEEPEFSLESGAWEENFKSHHDTKPKGPTAVALDFVFPDARAAYGLPEHADSLALKSTKGTDPYRLYNLDVFEYELNNGMSLYAAIPLLHAHGPKKSVGVFWLNAAETWVDVSGYKDGNVISSIVNLVSGSQETPHVDVHFMSESGIIDAFILMGPTTDDVMKQYHSLTGPAPLPQMFALGYHQSRWNYNDEDDVNAVSEGFDQHDIPMDVMWLDIEYTDNKKYFTWDPVRFSHPTEMNQNLTAKGRKLVAIIDCHFKREPGYFLYDEALSNGYVVQTRENKEYEGWCWPGSSAYLDLLDPTVRDYLSEFYMLEKFKGSTLDTYIWNDMNEPSVFNGPEVTMPKDNLHFGGWEHRDIHNIYGFLFTMTTYQGLLKRSQGALRPFILTRSAFAGSQRHAAIWTGDNAADWDHMRMSIPMCLSLALGGMPSCGADIGGFFKNPDAELFARWYQVGAFQTFYRAHSHIDTKRREPWSMGDTTTDVIRAALRKRYSYLPLFYTLAYEHERFSSLIMRPLFTEFSQDEKTFTIDNEYLLGRSLLIHPVQYPGVSQVDIYFPGEDKEVWYDADTFQKISQNGYQSIPVDLYKIPVYQRGGHIVSKKERIRRSSKLMKDDPYTLIVALDKNGSATGTLYIDDEESFEYRKGKFLYIRFSYLNGQLTARLEDKNGSYETKSWLERVVVVGLPQSQVPTAVDITPKGESKTPLQFNYVSNMEVLVIRKPAINMAKEWTINLRK